MSGEEDLDRLEDGLKVLELNLRRLVDKYQHLLQSMQYLGDDIAIFQSSLQAVSSMLQKARNNRREVKANVNGGNAPAVETANK